MLRGTSPTPEAVHSNVIRSTARLVVSLSPIAILFVREAALFKGRGPREAIFYSSRRQRIASEPDRLAPVRAVRPRARSARREAAHRSFFTPQTGKSTFPEAELCARLRDISSSIPEADQLSMTRTFFIPCSPPPRHLLQ